MLAFVKINLLIFFGVLAVKVMKDSPVSAPSPNFPKSMPKVHQQQIPITAAPVQVAPSSSPDMLDDGNSHEAEGSIL